MVATEVQSRKARRKEQRKAKKNSKRPRGTHDEVDNTSHESPAKKTKALKHKNNIGKGNKRETLVSKTKDPYAGLDPDVAAAMKSDDAEIAELEAKLGLANQKEKRKLHREYTKLEGYGDDFGDFLDDLDSLTNRTSGNPPDDANDGFLSHDDGDSYFSSEDEEVIPMKKYLAEDLEGDDESVESLEEGSGSDESEDENDKCDTDKVSESRSLSEEEPLSADSSDEDEDTTEGDHDIKDTYEPTEGEDIYGNNRDSPVSLQAPTKYVPPHLRKRQGPSDDTNRSQALRTLERLLNNVLNRLSEDTMISVAQSIANLYPSHPTSDVNCCLWQNLQSACVARPIVMTALVPVYVACIAGVHFQTGEQVQLGGHLLEEVVTALWSELSNGRSNCMDDSIAAQDEEVSKEACNLVLVLCYLYNYGIVHCTFMYSVVRVLIKEFSELDVELLLLMLSHCGYSLRSDDPSALKEIVLLVQTRATEAKANERDNKVASSSRVQYMISAITDLKNNKKSKQDVAYGEKTSELRKLLGRVKSTVAAKGMVRMSDSTLRITLEDVLNVETKGRWWKVGASWVGNQFQHRVYNDEEENSEPNSRDLPGRNKNEATTEPDEKLLQLASKLRMNTDIRRTIFCIIMGCEDCDDCFEKLVRAGMLKNRTERDTVRVLMECCGSEKSYNPFYSHLACRICDYQPQCKFTFQLAFWDMFKQFETIKIRKAANLAKLLFHMVAVRHALKMNILKAVDMSPGELTESGVIFLTIFFSSIFDTFDDPHQVKELFDRGIPRRDSASLKTQGSQQLDDGGEGLRESLSVFFLQTLKSSPKNKKKSKFRTNLKAATKACETDDLDSMMAL